MSLAPSWNKLLICMCSLRHYFVGKLSGQFLEMIEPPLEGAHAERRGASLDDQAVHLRFGVGGLKFHPNFSNRLLVQIPGSAHGGRSLPLIRDVNSLGTAIHLKNWL